MLVYYLSMMDDSEEKSKFTLVYKEYREQMHSVALNVLHNKEDAEDAVEAVFLKLVENMHLIGEPICDRTRGLLFIMAKHSAIDMKRKQDRRREVPYFDEIFTIQVEYAGPNGLSQCIAKLPDKYRDAILLKDDIGLTYKELAQAMGMSVANATKTHQRAVERLEELCKAAGVLS